MQKHAPRARHERFCPQQGSPAKARTPRDAGLPHDIGTRSGGSCDPGAGGKNHPLALLRRQPAQQPFPAFQKRQLQGYPVRPGLADRKALRAHLAVVVVTGNRERHVGGRRRNMGGKRELSGHQNASGRLPDLKIAIPLFLRKTGVFLQRLANTDFRYKIITNPEKYRLFGGSAGMFRDQEVAGSNPVAPTILSERSALRKAVRGLVGLRGHKVAHGGRPVS